MKVGGVSDISGEMVNSVSHDTLPVDMTGLGPAHKARPRPDHWDVITTTTSVLSLVSLVLPFYSSQTDITPHIHIYM